MNYRFAYLIGDAVFLIIWSSIFFYRKDIRKEMLFMSLIFGFAGILTEFVYTVDWWHPLTITGTRIGFEDFLFGFFIGGIASVIYEEIFSKKLRYKKLNKNKQIFTTFNFLILVICLAILFLSSFYLLKLSSFYASIFAFLIPIAYLWIKRKDLIFDSITSGLLLVLISFFGFLIPELIYPGVIAKFWYVSNLSGIFILKVPIEDLVWFFLAGTFIGPLYEFWQRAKPVDEKLSSSK